MKPGIWARIRVVGPGIWTGFFSVKWRLIIASYFYSFWKINYNKKMLKTICLYGYFPHISVPILMFRCVKRGDNRNLSFASKQKWQTVWIAFRWRDNRKKQTWCQRPPQKQILLRIYFEYLKQDSNFEESDIQELAKTLFLYFSNNDNDCYPEKRHSLWVVFLVLV